MDKFEKAADRAKAQSDAAFAETRHATSTVAFAFGGHISKGCLRRGRAGLVKRGEAAAKHLRAQIYLRISKLPNLLAMNVGIDTTKLWEEVS